MSQNLPKRKRSLGDVLSLLNPNHFALAGANNRNVIITYRFLAAPVQANRDFFYIDCVTVYFNCKYFPLDTGELQECLLGISPSGRNSCEGSYTYVHDSRFAKVTAVTVIIYMARKEKKRIWTLTFWHNLPFSRLRLVFSFFWLWGFFNFAVSTTSSSHSFVNWNRYPFSLPVTFELLNLAFFRISILLQQFTDVCLCFCQKGPRSSLAIMLRSLSSQCRLWSGNTNIVDKTLVSFIDLS